jgi:hypothetical protein
MKSIRASGTEAVSLGNEVHASGRPLTSHLLRERHIMHTGILTARVQTVKFPVPELGLMVFVALPFVALAIVVTVLRYGGLSSAEYSLTFNEYIKTMM